MGDLNDARFKGAEEAFTRHVQVLENRQKNSLNSRKSQDDSEVKSPLRRPQLCLLD